jgi:hypothetical protein
MVAREYKLAVSLVRRAEIAIRVQAVKHNMYAARFSGALHHAIEVLTWAFITFTAVFIYARQRSPSLA